MKRIPWTYGEIELLCALKEKGKSIAEIAKDMGRPVPSIKARLKSLAEINNRGATASKVISRKNKKGITWEIVRSIRNDWKAGLYTLAELNTKYGFNVRSIVYQRSWKE